MTAGRSQLDSSGLMNSRRIIAAASTLMVAVGCALSVKQVILFPGEFVLTAILSVGAAAVTLHRAWLVGLSQRGENLVLTKRRGKWVALFAVAAAAAVYVSTSADQRQFLGITAAVVMLVGYLTMVLLTDSEREPEGEQR